MSAGPSVGGGCGVNMSGRQGVRWLGVSYAAPTAATHERDQGGGGPMAIGTLDAFVVDVNDLAVAERVLGCGVGPSP